MSSRGLVPGWLSSLVMLASISMACSGSPPARQDGGGGSAGSGGSAGRGGSAGSGSPDGGAGATGSGGQRRIQGSDPGRLVRASPDRPAAARGRRGTGGRGGSTGGTGGAGASPARRAAARPARAAGVAQWIDGRKHGGRGRERRWTAAASPERGLDGAAPPARRRQRWWRRPGGGGGTGGTAVAPPLAFDVSTLTNPAVPQRSIPVTIEPSSAPGRRLREPVASRRLAVPLHQ